MLRRLCLSTDAISCKRDGDEHEALNSAMNGCRESIEWMYGPILNRLHDHNIVKCESGLRQNFDLHQTNQHKFQFLFIRKCREGLYSADKAAGRKRWLLIASVCVCLLAPCFCTLRAAPRDPYLYYSPTKSYTIVLYSEHKMRVYFLFAVDPSYSS